MNSAPTIGKCEDFYDGLTRHSTTIVVSPLRVMAIERNGEQGQRTYWGCSKYLWCKSSQCEYSVKSREEREALKQG